MSQSFPPSSLGSQSPPSPSPAAGHGRTPAPTLVNGSTVHGITGEQRLRHPWEIPLLVVGALITVGAYLLWTILVVMSVVSAVRGDGPTIMDIGDGPLGNLVIQLFAIVMLLPIILWVARAIMYPACGHGRCA